MSKFHSTVSRRDFMKGLGLADAGGHLDNQLGCLHYFRQYLYSRDTGIQHR